MITITQIYVKSARWTYLFDVEESEGMLVATCPQPNGGLNTVGKDWNELADMLVDCVKTWEEH